MAIKIKPSHRGLLHKNLGVKKGEKIPASKLAIKPGDSPAVKKRKQFAINAKKWHHAQDGTHLKAQPISADVPYPQARIEHIESAHPQSWDFVGEGPKPINWGHVALDTLLGLEAILPPEKSRNRAVRPQETYNQYPYGTGSQAIYKHGGELPCYGCGGEMQYGGKISTDGYKAGSKDINAPYLQIPSGDITMKGVQFPVLGIDNLGNSKMMSPGKDYQFEGTNVTEFPMKEPTGYVGQYGDQKAENGAAYPFGQFIMPSPAQSVPKFQVGGALSATGQLAAKQISPILLQSGRMSRKERMLAVMDKEQNTPYLNKLKDAWVDSNSKFLEASQSYEYTPNDYKDSIKLTQGKYNTGAIPKVMVDRAEQAAKKYGIDPYELLGLAGQESTFGTGYNYPKDQPIPEKSVVSGWNLAEGPQDLRVFLANNKVPGTRVSKTKMGYTGIMEDPNAVEQYLAKNPSLIDTYRNNLSKKDYSGYDNYFELAAQRIKKQGIKSYNPGDPDYPNKVAQSTALLRKDKGLTDYVASNRFDNGGWIIPTGVETAEGYRKEMMEYTHGGTMGENLQRDIYPSGVIKAQREVYNPLFQAGGIIPGLTGTMYSRNAYKSSEKITETMMGEDGAMIPYGNYMMDDGGELEYDEAKGGWIAKAAASIKRRGTKGKCTPITKPGCTGRAKALAKTFKKIARNRKKGEDGLAMEQYFSEGETYDLTDDQIQHLIRNDYDIQLV